MDKIPLEILEKADAVIERGYNEGLVEALARAILAERKRCAEVARAEARRYDTPHGSQPAYLAAYMIAEAIEAGQ